MRILIANNLKKKFKNRKVARDNKFSHLLAPQLRPLNKQHLKISLIMRAVPIKSLKLSKLNCPREAKATT